MTVINPNSISGITSITLPSGDSNVLTIHTSDGVERFRIDSSGNIKVGTAATISPDGDLFVTGVCTATTLAGSGANLTNLPAANVTGTLPAISGANLTSLTAGNLTGALPAISGANLTGIAATDNVRTGILDVAGIATFRSDVNIPNVNSGQIGGRRNKIYNGKMDVDQRNSGSAVTLSNNLTTYTVDRFSAQPVNMDQATDMTAQQVDDGPDGFAHSLKITTNTAESAIAADEFVSVYQKMEGQDFQDLAYNTSDTKDITMSFYVKSSITGTFGFTIYRDEPGTDRIVNKTYTINSANTWERKTITIAGDTSRAVNNTNTSDWWNIWHLAVGSNYDSATSSTWQNYTTTNWGGGHAQDGVITTAGATWQITGVQLEVGSQATAFEHRSVGEELALCQRYYQTGFIKIYDSNAGIQAVSQNFMPEMRAAPTITGTQFDSQTDAIWGSVESTTSRACSFFKNGVEICQRWICNAEL